MTTIPVHRGILTLSGVVRVQVDSGMLVVQDGIADERRQARFAKATCGIERLVVLGTDGLVSFAALKWLYDVGAGFVMLDWDNRILVASIAPLRKNTLLHRAQALAAYTPVGVDIVRELLRHKLEGQADNLRTLGKTKEAEWVSALALRLSASEELALSANVGIGEAIGRLRDIEKRAAKRYWEALADVPVRFARRDEGRIPEGWRVMGARASALTRAPRNASNPANALLNYLYALLEAETRLACLALGLHTGLGILHTDRADRDSFVYDLMEAVRPKVDRWLLDFLNEHRFAKRDFFETPEGGIRLTLPLRHELVKAMALWRAAIAPVAEWAGETLLRWYGKHVLGSVRAIHSELPTRLTERKRALAQHADYRTPELPRLTITACLECGQVTDGETFCSETCRGAYHEHRQAQFVERARENLRAMRQSEHDPARTEDAKTRQREVMKRRRQEQLAWERKHGERALQRERERFRREIWPRLRSIPLRRMARATGLSIPYCAQVRKGEHIPHPVHYEAFEALLNGTAR